MGSFVSRATPCQPVSCVLRRSRCYASAIEPIRGVRRPPDRTRPLAVATRAYLGFVRGVGDPGGAHRSGVGSARERLRPQPLCPRRFLDRPPTPWRLSTPTTPYGSVTSPLRQSSSRKDLSQRLQKFNGVGPVTTHIFLRDIKRLSVTRRPRLAERSTMQ